MEIYVNDKVIDYKALFPLSWGKLFESLLKGTIQHIPRDEGIIRIKVDGEEALHLMTDDAEKLVPQTTARVEIFTKNALEIIRESFGRIISLLDKIKEKTVNAADLYREGNIKDASENFVYVIETIKPVVGMVESVGQSFKLDFREILFNPATGQSLEEKIKTFLTTLQEVVMAQEKKDYVEMADYLEYQLAEEMDDWNKIINLLLTEVEAMFAKSN